MKLIADMKKKPASGSHKIEIIGLRQLSLDYREIGTNEAGSEHDELQFSQSISTRFTWNLDRNLFFVTIKWGISQKNNDESEKVFEIEIENTYLITNLKLLLEERGKAFSMPPDLLNTLVETSLSNTRGVAWALNKGSYLQKLIIPLLSADTFVAPLSEPAVGNRAARQPKKYSSRTNSKS